MQSRGKLDTLEIPTKRYRIGELVRYTPFSRQTIHNYTVMGLIQEVEWTEGGHRLYDESVFERLSKIIELKKTRTLDQIRHILSQEHRGGRSSFGGLASNKTAPDQRAGENIRSTRNRLVSEDRN
jgi:DNA-binding transcriptional MerR regulator